jgi:hypothetical protein
MDEGLAALRTVLATSGLPSPRTPRAALFLTLWWRFVLFLRGRSFRERAAAAVDPRALRRIDVCWSTTHCLAMSDYAGSAPFQALHLLLALRAGEPVRVARALASEAMTLGRLGGRAWGRTERVMETTMEVAQKTGRPETIGWAQFACGYACYLGGSFRRAFELLEASHQTLRECSGTAYEVASVQRTLLMCLAHMGQLAELRRRRPEYLREAFDRGDLFGVVNLRLGYSNIASLVDDDPDEARAEVADSLRQWTKQGFHLEHYFGLLARVNADLYAGDPVSALAHMQHHWPALRRSLLLSVQSVRILAHWGRGRAALAAGVLDAATRDARALEREAWGWSRPLAALLRAGIARARRSDEEDVRRLLKEAAAGFDATDMALHAAATRFVLGESMGGEEGAALVAQAEGWLRGQAVVNPARMVRMIAPGFG